MSCNEYTSYFVQHPAVNQLVRYLDKTAGREKTLRLLQYLCRLLGALQTPSPGSNALRLAAQFALTRKLLRFLKPLNHLQTAAQLHANTLLADPVARCLGVLRQLGYAAYLTLDQVNLLRILRILPATPTTAKRVPRWANWCWALALASSLLLDGRKVQVARAKIAELSATADSGDDEKRSAARRDAEAQQHGALRKLAWDALDALIVANNLGFVASGEQYVGAAGVVTSLMGVREVWQGCAK